MVTKEECFGCGACAQVCPSGCITMKENRDGFLIPNVDETCCVQCGACDKVCQMENDNWEQNSNRIRRAYLYTNTNEYYRNLSSSGGLFSAVANLILDKGGVVFGAALTDNFMVAHKCATNRIDVFPLIGSKYVQSDLGDTYTKVRDVLRQGKWALYVGTPCQIASLSAFLENENTSRLILMDLICHGVPSTKVWREYLKEIHNQDIRYIRFRDKRNGWWEYEFRVQYAHDEYTSRYRGGDDPYTNLFLKRISLNKVCYQCKYRSLHKCSDLFIGDAWNINRIRDNMDDDRGVTVVFVSSEKGQIIMDELSNDNLFEISVDEAVKYRPELLENANIPQERNIFFEKLDQGFKKAYESVNE